MAINYNAGKIVLDGLVLHLDAANKRSYPGSGTTWTDMSPTKVNGTLVNGATFNSANSGSILFDNVDDVVTVNHTSAHLVPNGTMIFWAKPFSDGTSNVSRFVNKGNDSVGTGGYNIALNTDLLLLRINGGTLSGTKSLIPYYNKWSQYTFTWTSIGQGKIYINDVLDISGALGATVSMTSTASMLIGNISGSSRTFDGYISIVQLYNRELTLPEIQQNYFAMKDRYNV